MSDQTIQFTPEEMDQAAQQEESERLQAEVSSLKQRVVLLRALVNRQHQEIEDLKPKVDTEVGEGINTAND